MIRTPLLVAAAGALLLTVAPSGAPTHVAAAAPGYTVTSGMFQAVNLGPSNTTNCKIAYDLYMPSPAPAAGTAPVILFTNGFGGSKADGTNLGHYFAPQGYVVMAYSGLGFGGSECPIELDDPTWDGRAASQIIDWLGQMPAVMKDGPGDPRVGMIGGSYGGAIQLSTASVTSKLDTIIPQITWNDLAYSLTPNNDVPSLQFTDAIPGVPKTEWTDLFFGEGASEPFQHPSAGTIVPTTVNGCPGFDPKVCPANLTSTVNGYPSASTIAFLRHASMVGYGSGVRIPTMLMQGEGDTLFNIDEAVANRARIMANGAYVKLVLQSWGHSFSNDPTDNTDFTDPAHPTYEDTLVQHWFDHYLKGLPVSTGPNVEYFRDWLYDPSAPSAQPAYGSAASWPVAPSRTWALSGTTDLIPTGATATAAHSSSSTGATVVSGTQTFASAPAPGPAPASYSETSALQYSNAAVESIPATDVPGTFASWTTAPLTGNLDVAGIPTLRIALSAAGTALGGTNPGLDPVVFTKLYDVDPSGGTSLLFPRLVAPARIASDGVVTITLPGVVHRFAAGHSVRLVLAASDMAYLNSRLVQTITASTDAADPAILSLPVLASSVVAPVTVPGGTAAAAAGSGANGTTGLANTGAAAPGAGGGIAVIALLGAVGMARRTRARRGAVRSGTIALRSPERRRA